MGEIISARLSDIQPSEEDQPIPRSLISLLGLYLNKEEGKLIPPIVRDSPIGLVTLDGRHRLLLEDLFGKQEVNLYLANSERDFMPTDLFPDSIEQVSESNLNLFRYNLAMPIAQRLKDNGINTYRDLRSTISHLKSLQTARSYYERNTRLKYGGVR